MIYFYFVLLCVPYHICNQYTLAETQNIESKEASFACASKNGNILITGHRGLEPLLTVWKVDSMFKIIFMNSIVTGHVISIKSVTICKTSNSYTVVSGGIDGSIQFWRLNTIKYDLEETNFIKRGHLSEVNSVLMSNECNILYTGGSDGLKVWVLESLGWQLKTSFVDIGLINSMIKMNNNIITAGSRLHSLPIYLDVPPVKCDWTHTWNIETMTLFDNKIYAGTEDGNIWVFATGNGSSKKLEYEQKMELHNFTVSHIESNSNYVISISKDNVIAVWYIKNSPSLIYMNSSVVQDNKLLTTFGDRIVVAASHSLRSLSLQSNYFSNTYGSKPAKEKGALEIVLSILEFIFAILEILA